MTGSGFKFGVVESSSSTPASTTGFNFGTLPSSTTTPNNGFKFGVTPSSNPETKPADASATYSAEFLADLKELNLSVCFSIFKITFYFSFQLFILILGDRVGEKSR